MTSFYSIAFDSLLATIFVISIFYRNISIKMSYKNLLLVLFSIFTWILAILDFERIFLLNMHLGIVIDGDGIKSIFVWYAGWLPAFTIFVCGLVLNFFINIVKMRREKAP